MMLNHFVTLILFQIKLWMILTDLLYLFYFIYFIYNKTKIKINLFVTDLTKLHVKPVSYTHLTLPTNREV